jgi:hypothetical protein
MQWGITKTERKKEKEIKCRGSKSRRGRRRKLMTKSKMRQREIRNKKYFTFYVGSILASFKKRISLKY